LSERDLTPSMNITIISRCNTEPAEGGNVAMKRRTSVLLDESLLKRARKVLGSSTNTEAITKALQEVLANKEIEVTLRDLIRKGRGRFVDVYR
jgi:hypothetical protein